MFVERAARSWPERRPIGPIERPEGSPQQRSPANQLDAPVLGAPLVRPFRLCPARLQLVARTSAAKTRADA
jgi:hypothetical protein